MLRNISLVFVMIFLITGCANTSRVKIGGLVYEEDFDEWINRPEGFSPQLSYSVKDAPYTTSNKLWAGSAIAMALFDIGSTMHALDNGCIELNPIVGKDPSLLSVVALKVAGGGIIYWLIEYIAPVTYRQQLRNWTFGFATLYQGAAGANNMYQASK